MNETIKTKRINTSSGIMEFLFVPQLTDRQLFADLIIQPLIEFAKTCESIDVNYIADNVIWWDDYEVKQDRSIIEDEVLNGSAALLLPNQNDYILLNTKKVAARSVTTPELMQTMHTAKDAFVENMDANLSLIRYRIKDNTAKYENLKLGRRTKINLCLIYLESIVNDKVLDDLHKRLEQIDVDGIVDIGELLSFLSRHQFGLFPEAGICERSDMAVGSILEGKIVILLEGSPFALIVPKVYSEFLATKDDEYGDPYSAIVSKIIRNLAMICLLLLAPLYVLIVTYKLDYLPANYLKIILEMRANVPFSPLVEVLIMSYILELIREAIIRVPKNVGPSVSIISAIILGEALIKLGVISSPVLFITSMSLLSSFVIPDFTIASPFRILSYLLAIIAGFFGIVGLIIGVLVVIIILVSSKSFGIPFFAPIIPFKWKDFIKTVFYSKAIAKERPDYLNLKQKKFRK